MWVRIWVSYASRIIESWNINFAPNFVIHKFHSVQCRPLPIRRTLIIQNHLSEINLHGILCCASPSSISEWRRTTRRKRKKEELLRIDLKANSTTRKKNTSLIVSFILGSFFSWNNLPLKEPKQDKKKICED